MSKAGIKKKLFGEFPGHPTSTWEELIHKDLKGADYQKKLIWKSLDGITVKPYFRAEDIEALKLDNPSIAEPIKYHSPGSESNDWLIRQDLTFHSPEISSKQILELIAAGVQSVGLRFESSVAPDVIANTLKEIPVNEVSVNFIGIQPAIVFQAFDSLISDGVFAVDTFKGLIEHDPLGAFVLSGNLGDESGYYQQLKKELKSSEKYTGIRTLSVNGRFYHNAGASIVQELGFTIAQAYEYLVELTEQGVDAQDVLRKMSLHLAVGSNYFFEIAKFRAVKLLWKKLAASFLITEDIPDSCLNAETSLWNLTAYDPHVNLLRATTEGMSAVIAGVHSLTIRPYDSCYKPTSEISRRLARNQQLLLKEEAYLNKVADPAAGSYYIEILTDSIGKEAWKLFKKVEEAGGFTEAFLGGFIQNEITTVAEKRDLELAQRKVVLLGTNQYPDFGETISDNIDHQLVNQTVVDTADVEAQPLNLYRGAQSFEALRLATEKSGKRPKVFLLPMGNLAIRKARSMFASNFFGCAGYEIIDNPGFETVEVGMAAAKAAKADIIVLCAADDDYNSMVPKAAVNIDQEILVVAGFPQASIEELQKAGAKYFIHDRSNLLADLKEFNQILGIQAY